MNNTRSTNQETLRYLHYHTIGDWEGTYATENRSDGKTGGKVFQFVPEYVVYWEPKSKNQGILKVIEDHLMLDFT